MDLSPFTARKSLSLCLAYFLATPFSHAATFDLPRTGDRIVGELTNISAKHEDTFVQLARRYGLGYQAIRNANPSVDPWLPGENTALVLPTRFILPDAPLKGIVINIAEMRLYYYPKPKSGATAKVVTYPISIGRGDWQTPLGTTRITKKVKNPTWYPPESIRKEHAERGDPLDKIVPSGPDNPLGQFAMKLALPGYLIHGTNRPSGIGMQVTHGCIRMFPEDIEVLYRAADVGTPVHIVNQPFKAGWLGEQLYLEAHPNLEEGAKAVETSRDLTPLIRSIVNATQKHQHYAIDWGQVMHIAKNARGIPLALHAKPKVKQQPTSFVALEEDTLDSNNVLVPESYTEQ